MRQMSLPLDMSKAKAPRFVYASHKGLPISHLPASFGRKVMPPTEPWHCEVAPWDGEVDPTWESLSTTSVRLPRQAPTNGWGSAAGRQLARANADRIVMPWQSDDEATPEVREEVRDKPVPAKAACIPPWQGPMMFDALPTSQPDRGARDRERRKAERQETERRQRLGVIRNAS